MFIYKKGVYVSMDKRTSLVIPEEVYWEAVAYAAKNKIKGGFKGVVMKALEELLNIKSGDQDQLDM